jgi:hypothetical protein
VSGPAAGDVQEQVDEMNAQGYLGIRSDPYGDEQYTLTTVGDALPVPPDDRTRMLQPSAETGAAPDPHVDSVTPMSMPGGVWADLAVVGSNFESTSKVEIDGTALGTTTFIDSTHLSLGFTALSGPMALTVRNESGMESNTVTINGTA